jgi:hypothetical protein
MNAAASNIGLMPTSSTDMATRSGGISSAKQDSSTTSFADSLKSARASDANAAPEKPEASKTNTPHTSGVIPSKPSVASPSNVSDSDTLTTPQPDDEPQTIVDASQPQAKNTNPATPAGADIAPFVPQKPAGKLQGLQDLGNDAAAEGKELENAEAPEASSPTTSVHSGDAKTAKKQITAHGAQATASKTQPQPQTQDLPATALAAVTQPVQAVVVAPAMAAANQNPQTKTAMSQPDASGKASKISAANPSVQQVAPQAAGPNASVQASAKSTDETPDSVEGAVEGSTFADKIIAATGSQHGALKEGGLDVTPQGATFSYSLHNAASLHESTSESSKSAIDTKTVATQDDTSVAQFTPVVRRLEVSVNDPVLGNVDVRAEMRGGALHASISGAQANTAAAAELHQFLQQHQVAVHTVSFQNTADVLRSTAPSSASTFSNNDSGSRENAQGSGSNASQQQNRHGSQESNQFLEGYLSGTATAASSSNRLASSQVSAPMLTPQSSGGNLSIHI